MRSVLLSVLAAILASIFSCSKVEYITGEGTEGDPSSGDVIRNPDSVDRTSAGDDPTGHVEDDSGRRASIVPAAGSGAGGSGTTPAIDAGEGGVIHIEAPDAAQATLTIVVSGTTDVVFQQELDPPTRNDVPIPDDLAPGQYTAIVRGVDDDGTRFEISFDFVVRPTIRLSTAATTVWVGDETEVQIRLPAGGDQVTITTSDGQTTHIEAVADELAFQARPSAAGSWVITGVVEANGVQSRPTSLTIAVQDRSSVIVVDQIELKMEVDSGSGWQQGTDPDFATPMRWTWSHPDSVSSQLEILDAGGHAEIGVTASTVVGDQLVVPSAGHPDLSPGNYQAQVTVVDGAANSLVVSLPFTVRPTIALAHDGSVGQVGTPTAIDVIVPGGGDRVDVYLNSGPTAVATLTSLAPGTHSVDITPTIEGTNSISALAITEDLISARARVDLTTGPDCGTPLECAHDDIKSQCRENRTAVTRVRYRVDGFSGCGFGEGENLGPVNMWLRARREVNIPFDLDGRIICGVEDFRIANSAGIRQRVSFDDHLLIAFNDIVVASSFQTGLERLSQIGGLKIYDWPQMRGASGVDLSASFDPPDFCINRDCYLPPSDTIGHLRLQLATEDVYTIGAVSMVRARTDHKLTLVALGDNDDNDCEFFPQSGRYAYIDVGVRHVIP